MGEEDKKDIFKSDDLMDEKESIPLEDELLFPEDESSSAEDQTFSDDRIDSKLFRLLKAKERLEDYLSRKDRISGFIEEILNSGIELSTFKEKPDIECRVEAFLNDILKDIFFSVHVPREQLFSEEFYQFLRIFERYLQQIEGLSFTIDTQASANGITYYFKSKDGLKEIKDFSSAIKRFDDFMDICVNNPETALNILKKKISDPQRALDILQELTTKYKRLNMDIQHQQQRLRLMITQDMETAMLELNIQGTPALLVDTSGTIQNAVDIVENNIKHNRLHFPTHKLTKEDVAILDWAKKYGEANDLIIIKSRKNKR